MMISPDGAKGNLDGVVDSVPPDKRCKVLDDITENFADSNDSYYLLKRRGSLLTILCYAINLQLV